MMKTGKWCRVNNQKRDLEKKKQLLEDCHSPLSSSKSLLWNTGGSAESDKDEMLLEEGDTKLPLLLSPVSLISQWSDTDELMDPKIKEIKTKMIIATIMYSKNKGTSVKEITLHPNRNSEKAQDQSEDNFIMTSFLCVGQASDSSILNMYNSNFNI